MPSWIVSICFHGTLMLFFAVGLQSCDSGASGASDEEFREVGIYIKDAVDLVENVQEDKKPVQDVEENTETDPQPSEAEIARAVENTAELPSELLELPELSPVKAPLFTWSARCAGRCGRSTCPQRPSWRRARSHVLLRYRHRGKSVPVCCRSIGQHGVLRSVARGKKRTAGESPEPRFNSAVSHHLLQHPLS